MPRPRSRPDACPGALQVHEAADGNLARVRLPGGVLTSAQIQTLSESAARWGNGELELTTRGNVQLRAVSDPAAFADRIAAAGLLPSPSHERVRNILASPLSGRVGGQADIRDLVQQLDRALCDAPALSGLPGRTLFTLDDGRGDVTPLAADFGVHATTNTESALLLAGRDTGVRLHPSEAVAALIESAHAFQAVRRTEWRLAEVPDGIDRVLERLDLSTTTDPLPAPAESPPPIGWLDQDDGFVTLGGGLPFGILDARLAEFLAAVERPVIITPWKTLLLCDLTEHMAEQVVRVLAPMGLIFDENSPWLHISACTGRPGCAKALADVRTDARAALERGEVPIVGNQHWSGCDRLCGRPRSTVTDVVATADGYLHQAT
ncbi:precorrin-3B synthase [Rhodococcus sp. NPDC058521]|uniref:precorrin-3B synthase n=1 Tax=Rhodococcus sp. NPDC058521 TaxID=3346536 RepID=UPI0036483F3E